MQYKVLLIDLFMEKQNDDLKAIREMMEKSTKFLSLSGMSGVIAGVTAILGALAYMYLLVYDVSGYTLWHLLALGVIVIAITLAFGIYFSWRKACRNHQKFFTKLAIRMLFHMSIPLLAGGVFALYFLFKWNMPLVFASTLVFYGLALLNVSKFTYSEIQYLGLTEVLLGLLTLVFFQYWGIIVWAVGFGICHIVYGIVMYCKYDAQKSID